MKRRFSLFTYPMMDMKAAEAELNRRAAAGWQLEKVWMGVLAVFGPRPMYRCATVSTGAIRAGTTGPATALCWPTRGGGCASG